MRTSNLQRSARRLARGFTLIESMISMFVLTVGVLGVAQVHGLASRQNGVGRRTMIAAALARDLAESVQRMSYDAPPLVSDACGANMTDWVDDKGGLKIPVTEQSVGDDATPDVTFTWSKVLEAPSPTASSAADAEKQTYLDASGFQIGTGMKRMLFDEDLTNARFQAHIATRLVNPTNFSAATGCRAKIVTLVVRYTNGNDKYRNLVIPLIKYDPAQIVSGQTLAENF